jgi:small nuclear ribonucleoprotein (snRNP)-like protein
MLDTSEIELLKRSVDQNVEIETESGEKLVAKVLFVVHSVEYDEHELLYEVVSSNMVDSYQHRETSGGYVLDFNEIVSMRPHQS